MFWYLIGWLILTVAVYLLVRDTWEQGLTKYVRNLSDLFERLVDLTRTAVERLMYGSPDSSAWDAACACHGPDWVVTAETTVEITDLAGEVIDYRCPRCWLPTSAPFVPPPMALDYFSRAPRRSVDR